MVTVSLEAPDMAASPPSDLATGEVEEDNRRQAHTATPEPVDMLVLGAGWTSRFLRPLLDEHKVRWAATTTTGRDGTVPFRFDPDSADPAPYRALPTARTVLITFPLKGEGQSRRLTSLYSSSRPTPSGSSNTSNTSNTTTTRWIQLGSTGIFTSPGWNDESSPYDAANPRAAAEDELLSRCGVDAVVLALAGLHDGGDGTRDPRDWVLRVARTKDAVRAKGALHLIHGADVARAVLAVHTAAATLTSGRRWIVADTRCYDWWDLIQAWGAEARRRLREGRTRAAVAAAEAGVDADGLRYEEWVAELMQEEGVRALPRPPERLGRVLDSRAFWKEMGTWPLKGRVC
ncbi:hypothetical protein RB595_009396 [Gaeumannomyces hyphopodioides]